MRSDQSRRTQTAFIGGRLFSWLAAISVLAAGVLIGSGAATQRTDPTIAKPSAVLVAIRNTTEENAGPGLAAFVAVIQPKSRSIGIVRVPSDLPTAAGQPLAEDPSLVPAAEIADDVEQNMHVKLSGYIVIDATVVREVFATLWQDTPNWPHDLTPDQALSDLGWPDAHATSKAQTQIVGDLIEYVPQVQHDANLLVSMVLRGASTDISPYELFVLVTYVNDEKITQLPLQRLPSSLIEKQVTH